MLSLREKKIKESVELMFQGLDDDVLKTVVMYSALCKSEEEKDAICEEIRKKNEEDLAYFTQRYEIEINKDNAEEVLKLIMPDCTVGETTFPPTTPFLLEKEESEKCEGGESERKGVVGENVVFPTQSEISAENIEKEQTEHGDT